MADLFDHRTIGIAEQIRCAERELVMRRKVYPGWVARGRMDERKAAAEIAAMSAIVTTLKDVDRDFQARAGRPA